MHTWSGSNEYASDGKGPGRESGRTYFFNRKFSVSKKLLTYDLSAYVFFGLYLFVRLSKSKHSKQQKCKIAYSKKKQFYDVAVELFFFCCTQFYIFVVLSSLIYFYCLYLEKGLFLYSSLHHLLSNARTDRDLQHFIYKII